MDNTNTQVATGTTGTTQATDEATAKLYATRSEAEAAKPADAKSLKPFEVLVNGTSKGWVLARGHAHAIEQVARLDGYSATLGNGASVTKEAVAAKLATFSDDELKALGLTRKKTGTRS